MKSREYLKNLRSIYIALLQGVIVLGVALAIFGSSEKEPLLPENTWGYLFVILLALTILSIPVSMMLKKNYQRKINKTSGLFHKMMNYRRFYVIRLLMWKFIVIASLVSFFLTLQLFFVGLAVVVLFALILFRPTAERVIREAGLDEREREILRNPDAVLS